MIGYLWPSNKDLESFLKDFDDLYDTSEGEKKVDRTRKDYCYDCSTDELYWHAMTAKCKKCHTIILGGEEDAKKEKS